MIRRRLIAPVALTLGFAPLALVAPPPAYAAPAVLTVCLSSESSGGPITVWQIGHSYSFTLGYGECGQIGNVSGKARVSVRYGDYKIKPFGGSYGPCHNGPNPDSNPPDGGAYYRTKTISYC